jgi:excisionase family DNA binding protein
VTHLRRKREKRRNLDCAASPLDRTTGRGEARSVPLGNATDDHLLDKHAAAAFLRVAPRTLYKWAAQGRLPVVHLGRAIRFRMSALRTLVREHEEPATMPLGGVASLVGAGTERATPTRP